MIKQTNKMYKKNILTMQPLISYREALKLDDESIISAYKQLRIGDFIAMLTLRFLIDTLSCRSLTPEVGQDVDKLSLLLKTEMGAKVDHLVESLLSMKESEYSYMALPQDIIAALLGVPEIISLGQQVSKPLYFHYLAVSGRDDELPAVYDANALRNISMDGLFRLCVRQLAGSVNILDIIEGVNTAFIERQAEMYNDVFHKVRASRINAMMETAVDFASNCQTPEGVLRILFEQEQGGSMASLLSDSESIPDDLKFVAASAGLVMSATVGAIPSRYIVELFQLYETGES